MIKIAFLACAGTLSRSIARRPDAFEHDLQFSALAGPFAQDDLELLEMGWQAPPEAFAPFTAALVATTWDYALAPNAFVEKLERLEASGVRCFNPPSLIKWNCDKGYLQELARAGIPTIPTIWSDRPGAHTLRRAFETFSTDRLVVKKRTGAGAEGQEILSRGQTDLDRWVFAGPAMIQPFLDDITVGGELSLIFIDGEYSHAVLKQPAPGDYRIQSVYGGTEHATVPPPSATQLARAIIEAMPDGVPLYARIDLVHHRGDYVLMEAEAIEPYLYPQHGPRLGELMAAAIRKRLPEAPACGV